LLQFERFVQQDLGLATTAFRMVVESLGGDAVEAVAVGAGDEEWVGHGENPVEKQIALSWRRLLTFSIVQHQALKLG
jgi:hypothetical protein